MIWKIIGFTAAFLTMFGFVPQIIKVWQHRSAKDVSLITLLQFFLGALFWLSYGMHLKDGIIITANSITAATVVILLYLYFRFGK